MNDTMIENAIKKDIKDMIALATKKMPNTIKALERQLEWWLKHQHELKKIEEGESK